MGTFRSHISNYDPRGHPLWRLENYFGLLGVPYLERHFLIRAIFYVIDDGCVDDFGAEVNTRLH